jgi:hypothetical protein
LSLYKLAEADKIEVLSFLGKHLHKSLLQQNPLLQSDEKKVLKRLHSDSTISDVAQHKFGLSYEMTTSPNVAMKLIFSMDYSSIQLGVQHTSACKVDTDVYNRIQISAQTCQSYTVIECIVAAIAIPSQRVILRATTD